MRFDLSNGTRNILLNMSNKDAAYRQSPTEHEELLHQFERDGQTPLERMLAIEKGEIAEAEEPKYWDDQVPRRDVGGSSTFIREIEYIPSIGIAVITTSNGKKYFYPKTEKEVGDLVTSNDIGSQYNNYWKGK